MDNLTKYLGIVTIVGFILYCINMLLYKHTKDAQIDFLVTVTSLAGGSFGIVMAILLFDRKATKENMMSRVFISCIFIIQH